MPPRIKYFPLLVPISPGLSRLLFSPMLNNCRGCRVDSLQNRMVGDCRRAVRALRAEDSQTATPATAFRLAAVTRGPEGTFRLQPSMQAARLGPKPHSRSNHDFLEQNRRLGCVSMAVGDRATKAASTPENRRAQDVLQVLWLSMLERQCKELDSFDASLSGIAIQRDARNPRQPRIHGTRNNGQLPSLGGWARWARWGGEATLARSCKESLHRRRHGSWQS